MDRIYFETKFAAAEDGTIEGHCLEYSEPDRVGDVITKGAFAGTSLPLPMLFGHDQNDPVGTWDASEDRDDGFHLKGRLLVEDVARAREVSALVKAGAVRGISIGFRTKTAKRRAKGGRTISSLELLEASLVVVPMHPGARVTAAKDAIRAITLSEQIKRAAAHTEVGMKHLSKSALTDSAAIILKDGEEDEANDVVTKALEELTGTIDKRLDEQAEEHKKLGDRLDKVEAKANRAKGDGGDDPDEMVEAEKKAFGNYLRLGSAISDEDKKALTTTNDPQAGYLAPSEMSTEFIRDLVEVSPIRSVASVRSITSPSVKYPKRTGITNAQWEGEAEEAEESTASFGQLEVTVHKLTTYVDISNELLSDSGGTARSEVRMALAEDFGQKEGLAFVNGTGSGQPEGLMTHPGIGETVNGSTSAVSPDKLIDLMYSLPSAYRNRGAWMMNGTTLAELRKLKDGDGRFLWQPSFQAGQPETILGRPVVEAVDMPDIASGAFPILYGDFAAYRIVDRLTMTILSDPYTQATKGVTRMHATRRVGGRVLQAARFKKLKMSTS